MKPKILTQVVLQSLILTILCPVFAESTSPVQTTPVPEETAEAIEEEQDESAVFEARIDALSELISIEVNASGLEKGKKTQIRSMAIAAYRENNLTPLWTDLVELEEAAGSVEGSVEEEGTDQIEEPAADSPAKVEDVVDENVTVIAEAGIEEVEEQPSEELDSAPLNPDDEVFESLRSFLALHGFGKTNLSFGPKAEAQNPEYPIPVKDLMITLALAEVCLRLKQGPDSIAEWPNWTFSDLPDGSTKDYYNELTSRYGEIASKALSPIEIAEDFVPKNWVYHRIHQAIQGVDEAPEPPQIEIDGLVKVGNEFPRARELADFLLREEFLSEDQIEAIDGVYTEPLSEAVRAFQKAKNLQSDGILGPSTARKISQKAEDEMEKLHINLHRARRLPDNPGDRYLLANLPAGEVYGFANDKEELRMRIVFGKHKRGQHTPIFRDKMENVVFRPYWNVPYSIAVSESPYSNLSYLGNNGFKIISSSSGAELPLTIGSLESVRSRSAYIRQDGGSNNALGLVKFLFPNRHAVYFHDTPQKHYFKNSYRAQSHGCVRLEKPEAMANWVLGDLEEWTPEKIKSSIYRGSRKSVDLETPIPVYVVYFTAFPDSKKESGVDFHRDCYDYDLPGAVVDAPGPKLAPTKLPEVEEKGGLFKFLRSRTQSNRSNSSRREGGGFFERLKGKQN